MKVAIYCRVSTEEQNPKHQEDDLVSYCQMQKYDIHKVYTDIVSGYRFSASRRPNLNQLMMDAYERKFNAVLVWKLDRMGRSLPHLIDIVNKLQSWKIDFICKTQDIDTTSPNGKLLFHIFGAIAQFERDIIRERTILGMKKAKNVGKRGKDKRPRKRSGYWMRWSKKGGHEKTPPFIMDDM